MSVHIAHPSIRENGLADGCPRCGEHAEYPFEGLDDGNLDNLINRVVDKETPRSTQEAIAMAKASDAMTKATVLWRRGWRPS
ncbi:hypothetical protein LCGC14_2390350 [marine sediment metagenome]|uniref:Uncharacterized protein n=1 Tax=marine sediment metagenome TaxID=412755 RepID=A0A0F9BYB4_9ZZZZ